MNNQYREPPQIKLEAQNQQDMVIRDQDLAIRAQGPPIRVQYSPIQPPELATLVLSHALQFPEQPRCSPLHHQIPHDYQHPPRVQFHFPNPNGRYYDNQFAPKNNHHYVVAGNFSAANRYSRLNYPAYDGLAPKIHDQNSFKSYDGFSSGLGKLDHVRNEACYVGVIDREPCSIVSKTEID